MKNIGFLFGLMFSLFMYLRFANAPFLTAAVVYLLLLAILVEFFLHRKIDKMNKWILTLSKMIIAYTVSVSFCFLLLDNSIFKQKIIIILVVSFVPSMFVNFFLKYYKK